MSITKLKFSNFKSFENVDVTLSNFNVLIGTNASGKSNLVKMFSFLRDIANRNMEIAISRQGGIEYLRNVKIGSSEELSVELTSDKEFRFPIELKNDEYILTRIYETNFRLSLQFTEEKPGYKISEEHIMFMCEFYDLNSESEDIIFASKEEEGDKIGEGIIKLSNTCGKIKINVEDTGIGINGEDIIPKTILNLIETMTKEGTTPLLDTPLAGLPVSWISIFTDVAIYDFDPKSSKLTTKNTGNKLKENGENLAIMLQHIKDDKENERKFLNLLRDLLPFVDDINVESFVDKQLIFLLKEKYYTEDLPASHISDGTANILDLILALYFENEKFIIIEEPERNVHPHLLSKIVQMMKETSKKKQIIVTTHNPEILKYSNNEDVYFISRNKKGFSTISKPTEKEELKFLLNEIGIEELYVDNMLGE
ncbi:MAG: AAA family ATPase [Methanobacterium sp.]